MGVREECQAGSTGTDDTDHSRQPQHPITNDVSHPALHLVRVGQA